MDGLLLAFAVTLGAGLATGIGSTLAFFTKTTNKSFFAIAMGFSAGVMVYLSFVEILPKSTAYIARTTTDVQASAIAALALVAGMIVMAIIDALVPSGANPHENTQIELMGEEDSQLPFVEQRANKMLLRTGLFIALAIAIHNFPEGLATFLLVLDDPQIGIALAIAVAMHNIPEGIAVSVPVYYATKSKARAFRLSFLSGLAEPAGAVIGYLLLSQFLNDFVLGVVFAMVAGVMVFLAIDTLLPTARNSSRGHLTVYGFIAGVAVMAASLVLLRL
ncbi:MAG: zinc transporter ZupT [Aquiluna sp.]|nr:zinc transporter ZupT [Aquiluna sp.]MCF8546187.1 zinc transporter ZupT [Aquiluna sp.]